MGNRILKESILYSRSLSNLSWFERVMFEHLIVAVDDYGIYYADPVLLAHALFPREDNVTAKMIRDGLTHMEEQHMICRYTVEGEDYLKLTSWEKHQRLRSSRRRFPGPDMATPGIVRPAEEQEQEPPQEEEDTEITEPEVRELPIVELPLNDNTSYCVTREEAGEYAALYPAVDVQQELRNMRGWCLANPARRKTKSGVKKFINGWLSREQDRTKLPAKPPDNPYLDMLKKMQEEKKKEQAS